MASGLFRFIAILGRNMVIASTFGTFGLLIILVMGGFIISKGKSSEKRKKCSISCFIIF